MIRHHRDATYRNNTLTRTAEGAGTCSGGALKITPGIVSRPARWLYGSGSLFKPMESGYCGDGCPQESSPSNNPEGSSEPYIRIVSGDMMSAEAHETLLDGNEAKEERLTGVNEGCYAVVAGVTTEVDFDAEVLRSTKKEHDDEGNTADPDHEVVEGLLTAESELLRLPYFTIDPNLQTLPMRKRISVLFNLLTKAVADLSMVFGLQLMVQKTISLLGKVVFIQGDLDSSGNLMTPHSLKVVKLLNSVMSKYLIHARAISMRRYCASQTGCNWIFTGVRMDASPNMLSNLGELNKLLVRGAVQ